MKDQKTTNDYAGTLHVYSQYSPHDDAVIVGTKDALVSLRDAITRAIEVGAATTTSSTADGEGFAVQVKVRESDSYYNRVGLPYSAEYYGAPGDALDPRDPEADDE